MPTVGSCMYVRSRVKQCARSALGLDPIRTQRMSRNSIRLSIAFPLMLSHVSNCNDEY